MKRGFTLVEMLVAVAILIFMVSVILANTRSLTTLSKVKATAGLVLDTAKETRSKAISVQQFQNSVFPSYGLSVSTANNTVLNIYADCKADDNDDNTINNLDTFAFNTLSTQCNGGNGLVQQVTLPPNMRIKRITSNYAVGSTMTTYNETKADILFLRPEPTIWMVTSSGGLMPVGRIDIVVGDSGNKYERTVTFYSTGQFFIKK